MSLSSNILSSEQLFQDFLHVLEQLNIRFAICNLDMKLLWATDSFITAENSALEDDLKVKWKIKKTTNYSSFIKSPANNIYDIFKNTASDHLILISKTITEEKRKEEKKAIKKIAHDLSNTITNTLNSAEIIKSKVNVESDCIPILDSIINNTIRSSEMIDALFEENFIISQKKFPLDVFMLIKGLGQSLKSSLPSNINFETHQIGKLFNVSGNPSDLYRVLLNLCTNSIEAMPNGGNLDVTVKKTFLPEENELGALKGDFVQIEITDTGVGIPKNQLKKVFDLNFTTKRKGSESGFGLNIVREIIEDHNGMVEVTSEENKGTTFKILLPSEEKITTEEFTGNNKRILIAEDEIYLLELLEELLESFKFKVIKAKDGEEVLNLFKTDNEFSLLIIDKKMPKIDGGKCVEEIRKTDKTIPIIIASGSRGSNEFQFINDANLRFLKKPYNFDQLIGLVKELIG